MLRCSSKLIPRNFYYPHSALDGGSDTVSLNFRSHATVITFWFVSIKYMLISVGVIIFLTSVKNYEVSLTVPDGRRLGHVNVC
jgi:hypothetical protein